MSLLEYIRSLEDCLNKEHKELSLDWIDNYIYQISLECEFAINGSCK
jgi:hypothetical protein